MPIRPETFTEAVSLRDDLRRRGMRDAEVRMEVGRFIQEREAERDRQLRARNIEASKAVRTEVPAAQRLADIEIPRWEIPRWLRVAGAAAGSPRTAIMAGAVSDKGFVAGAAENLEKTLLPVLEYPISPFRSPSQRLSEADEQAMDAAAEDALSPLASAKQREEITGRETLPARIASLKAQVRQAEKVGDVQGVRSLTADIARYEKQLADLPDSSLWYWGDFAAQATVPLDVFGVGKAARLARKGLTPPSLVPPPEVLSRAAADALPPAQMVIPPARPPVEVMRAPIHDPITGFTAGPVPIPRFVTEVSSLPRPESLKDVSAVLKPIEPVTPSVHPFREAVLPPSGPVPGLKFEPGAAPPSGLAIEDIVPIGTGGGREGPVTRGGVGRPLPLSVQGTRAVAPALAPPPQPVITQVKVRSPPDVLKPSAWPDVPSYITDKPPSRVPPPAFSPYSSRMDLGDISPEKLDAPIPELEWIPRFRGADVPPQGDVPPLFPPAPLRSPDVPPPVPPVRSPGPAVRMADDASPPAIPEGPSVSAPSPAPVQGGTKAELGRGVGDPLALAGTKTRELLDRISGAYRSLQESPAATRFRAWFISPQAIGERYRLKGAGGVDDGSAFSKVPEAAAIEAAERRAREALERFGVRPERGEVLGALEETISRWGPKGPVFNAARPEVISPGEINFPAALNDILSGMETGRVKNVYTVRGGKFESVPLERLQAMKNDWRSAPGPLVVEHAPPMDREAAVRAWLGLNQAEKDFLRARVAESPAELGTNIPKILELKEGEMPFFNRNRYASEITAPDFTQSEMARPPSAADVFSDPAFTSRVMDAAKRGELKRLVRGAGGEDIARPLKPPKDVLAGGADEVTRWLRQKLPSGSRLSVGGEVFESDAVTLTTEPMVAGIIRDILGADAGTFSAKAVLRKLEQTPQDVLGVVSRETLAEWFKGTSGYVSRMKPHETLRTGSPEIKELSPGMSRRRRVAGNPESDEPVDALKSFLNVEREAASVMEANRRLGRVIGQNMRVLTNDEATALGVVESTVRGGVKKDVIIDGAPYTVASVDHVPELREVTGGAKYVALPTDLYETIRPALDTSRELNRAAETLGGALQFAKVNMLSSLSSAGLNALEKTVNSADAYARLVFRSALSGDFSGIANLHKSFLDGVKARNRLHGLLSGERVADDLAPMDQVKQFYGLLEKVPGGRHLVRLNELGTKFVGKFFGDVEGAANRGMMAMNVRAAVRKQVRGMSDDEVFRHLPPGLNVKDASEARRVVEESLYRTPTVQTIDSLMSDFTEMSLTYDQIPLPLRRALTIRGDEGNVVAAAKFAAGALKPFWKISYMLLRQGLVRPVEKAIMLANPGMMRQAGLTKREVIADLAAYATVWGTMNAAMDYIAGDGYDHRTRIPLRDDGGFGGTAGLTPLGMKDELGNERMLDASRFFTLARGMMVRAVFGKAYRDFRAAFGVEKPMSDKETADWHAGIRALNDILVPMALSQSQRGMPPEYALGGTISQALPFTRDLEKTAMLTGSGFQTNPVPDINRGFWERNVLSGAANVAAQRIPGLRETVPLRQGAVRTPGFKDLSPDVQRKVVEQVPEAGVKSVLSTGVLDGIIEGMVMFGLPTRVVNVRDHLAELERGQTINPEQTGRSLRDLVPDPIERARTARRREESTVKKAAARNPLQTMASFRMIGAMMRSRPETAAEQVDVLVRGGRLSPRHARMLKESIASGNVSAYDEAVKFILSEKQIGREVAP